jgi:hypothetical protein
VIGWLFGVGAVLVVAAWIGSRRRLKRLSDSELSDADLRRIEASGWVERDEPLDLEEAEEEEERFWGETWDEPDPL